ncbi:hypothetical protein [Methanosarcina mazei]|jgi:hypothetical protein|uniref:Uncharacterized protein n=2 Tax=Methanosarcina mazei TaxID=2209 RepID=A0A0F8H3V4_METMZ|nr:hypothetical protein [Methanosarcina mazei]AKB60716.1 hypothetical protein MSMAP_0731 [Methanosarcina mazei SarPi]KKG30243.1 hypothetical protein DU49_09025 [Methanosarcina mazei]KKG37350.1 hypothetical protein DU35_16345 [Methanosarcina mazei]KKG46083.1 hypothetical protein DU39_14965 [Methanosarcina mazei]KKG46448.1 hypothetical protein DU41_07755 [Methanosarcina mazei]
MSHLIVPERVLDDINEFIRTNYTNFHHSLPHSLIISQAFCLRFKEYGNDFGVSVIADAVEYVKKSSIENKKVKPEKEKHDY